MSLSREYSMAITTHLCTILQTLLWAREWGMWWISMASNESFTVFASCIFILELCLEFFFGLKTGEFKKHKSVKGSLLLNFKASIGSLSFILAVYLHLSRDMAGLYSFWEKEKVLWFSLEEIKRHLWYPSDQDELTGSFRCCMSMCFIGGNFRWLRTLDLFHLYILVAL